MIATTPRMTEAPPGQRIASDGIAQPRTRTKTIALPWYRLALSGILGLAALLNVWALDSVGYANGYYAAAVRSMLRNWHNFFFVSFDPGGFVTIDKPSLGFWIETASAKLFGFSGVSVLLPEALAGVLSVAVLYRLVARTWGRGAGLLAALLLALTPVSVVTSRNNTIDSLLVLTVLLGAWAVLKAAETGRLRWLLACAVLVGLGFNIKMLEAYLVVPAFGLVYLWSAPGRLLQHIGHLALASIALLVVSLSWAVAVDLTPASLRPYVGSSGTNSELNLALGYNGLSRLSGGAGTPGGGDGGGGGGNGLFNGGPAGLFRLLGTTLGGQVSWLLVLAVLGVAAAATVVPWRRPDARGRSLVLWSGWLLTAGAFFSVAEFFHPYYTVMLAPAVAAPAAIGVTVLWRAYRGGGRRGLLLPLVLLATAGGQAYILRDYPDWSRWLTPLVVGACLVAALTLVVARLRPRRLAQAALVAASVSIMALLVSPTAWAAYSVTHAVSAGIPTAGPSAQATGGNGGPGGPGGSGGGPGGGAPSATSGSGSASNGPGANGGPGGGISGGPGGANGQPGGSGSSRGGFPGGPGGFPGGPGGGAGGPGGGGPGGDLGGQSDAALIRYLEARQGTATYLVATASSMNAESIIIATGKPVMALGGFNGNDQILTAQQLAALVKAGTVRYFLIGSGGFGGPPPGNGVTRRSASTSVGAAKNGAATGGPGGNSALTQWVTTHCTVVPSSQYQASTSTSTASGQSSGLYACGSAAASHT